MELTKKEKFVELLKKSGFDADFSSGVPVIYANSKEEIEELSRQLEDIAKKNSYNESRGVKVRKKKLDQQTPLKYESEGGEYNG